MDTTTPNNTPLQEMLLQRQMLKGELQKIENKIFTLENTYLSESTSFGNVLRGWEIKNAGKSNNKVAMRANVVSDTDKWFSLSSVTSPVQLTGQDKLIIDTLSAAGQEFEAAARECADIKHNNPYLKIISSSLLK